MLSTTITKGFFSRSRVSESNSCSEPAVVPPGLSTCTMTARAVDDRASRSSCSTRSRSPRINPEIVTRAIYGRTPVRPMRLLAKAVAPAMPRTITATARTRQKVSLRRRRRRSTIRSASSDMVSFLIQLPPPHPSFRVPSKRGPEIHNHGQRPWLPNPPLCSGRNDAPSLLDFFLLAVVVFFVLFALTLERGAQNIAERCTRIRRAVLRDRLLLLGDFQRLDGDRDTMRAAIELGDPGVDLLANRKAIRTLFGTVAGEFRTLDEGRKLGADDLHVDAAFLHVGHLASDDDTLLQLAAGRFGAGAGAGALGGRTALGKLLDAKRNALFLDVDVEHLGGNLVALLVLLDDLLAGAFPIQIGQMHHAVDVAIEPEEQAEFGLVLDLALDHRAGRIFLEKHFPRIAHGLFEAE